VPGDACVGHVIDGVAGMSDWIHAKVEHVAASLRKVLPYASRLNGALSMTEVGRRVKAAGCALGVGVLVSMAALAAVETGGQAQTALTSRSGAQASTQSTAPSAPATSIASPTLTAMPYGGEGCIGKDCFPGWP
jgi:hypothetical protein